MTGARIHYADDQIRPWCGDALATLRQLPDESVNCAVTSPPYFGLRDYGEPGQYGLEATPTAYVETMRAVFAEVRRVLAPDGTLWLNLGDTYAGKGNAGASVGMTRRADRAELIPKRVNTTAEAPYKSLLMIPERVAWALVDDGWTLRNRIVWHKPSAMPESVTDRLSTRHEALFLFAKSAKYHFDLDAIREPHSMEQRRRTATHNYNPPSSQPEHRGLHRVRPDKNYDGHPAGRNPGDVWTIPAVPFPDAHFAVFPPALAERCVLAGCRPGGVVLDPFCGSGTTGMVALRHGRRFVGIDLSAKYLDLALRTRLAQIALIDPAVAG
jgi:DNA modification methylase